MESGRPVYVEGADIGFNNNAYDIWPYFGASYLDDGSATGNVSSVSGRTGTFAQGLGFAYPYGQGPDNYVDELGPSGGQLLLDDQSSLGRAVVNQTATYRTVLSSVIAGAFEDSDRGEFITACVSYLVEGLGVAGPTSTVPQRLTLRPSLVVTGGVVSFSAPVAGATLFDAGGRFVRAIPGGTTALSCAGLPAGAYVVRAGSAAWSFTVVR